MILAIKKDLFCLFSVVLFNAIRGISGICPFMGGMRLMNYCGYTGLGLEIEGGEW
jgi:hypothetical protein